MLGLRQSGEIRKIIFEDKFLFNGAADNLPLWGRGTATAVDEVCFVFVQTK